VGAEIDERAWPDDPELERAAGTLGCPIAALRFGPSDDYELLLAIDPASRNTMAAIALEHGVPLTVVGRFTSNAGELQRAAGTAREPLTDPGFDHFAAPAGEGP
jgi:thiamine monophosphate kinase